MNNKNKVDGFRGSLANARDDIGYLVRRGGRSGDSSNCYLKMQIPANRRFSPPNDHIYTCHSER